MTQATRPSISKQEAQALLDDIRSNLLNAEAAIVTFIRARGWEPLGYSTFVEAWSENLKGVRFALSSVALSRP